ncbi:MAG: Gfo/Idh/MocA family oxidoreductase [Sphingomonas fennica]
MTVKVGVIGTGMIGLDHIRRLTEVLAGARVVAVSDINPERVAAVVERIPGARAYATGEALIDAADVDAVLIASWGPTHEAYLLHAIKAGKPVFCEKPLATTQEACLRVIDAEVAHGKRLVQVGFMRRFDHAYRVLKDTVAGGAIGAPLLYHAAHRNPSVPDTYTSDMAIIDTLVHDIDVARWLFDEEVTGIAIRAPRANSKGGILRDPIFALMDMAGGALVTVEVSVNIDYAYDIRGEMSGENGTVELAESNAVVVKTKGVAAGRVPADWRERFITAYDEEFRAWLAAAAQGTATGPSAWDGYAAQAVCDAGVRAATSREIEPVRLRDRPALYG